MNLENIFNMLGGLGLFLFGIGEMSKSLKMFSGSLIEDIIKKFTTNKYIGVLVGFIITALIQSSSATTVIVVGLVNAGMMALEQTVGVIMGANVGTTVTSLIIAINLLGLAPIIIFIGAILLSFKSNFLKSVGSVLTGFGILFLGMNMMSKAAKPISRLPVIKEILMSFENPFIGLLAGLVFTAIVQSSSVSIGILEALGLGGAISLWNASFIIYGQNIGTCVTALIAAVGAGVTTKRTVAIHVLFNLVGAAIFTGITLFFPFLPFLEQIFPQNIMIQISAVHILFNLISTVLLLPFSNLLIKLSCKIVPENKN